MRALGGPLVCAFSSVNPSIGVRRLFRLMVCQMNLENRAVFAITAFRKLQANFENPKSGEGFAETLDVEFEVNLLEYCTAGSLFLTEYLCL